MSKNFARKASKSRQQTQLSFHPVDPTSSPAAAPVSSGLQPANVRYELPGGRKRSSKKTNNLVEPDLTESDDALVTGVLNNLGSSAERKEKERKAITMFPQKAFPSPAKTQKTEPVFESGFLGEYDLLPFLQSIYFHGDLC